MTPREAVDLAPVRGPQRSGVHVSDGDCRLFSQDGCGLNGSAKSAAGLQGLQALAGSPAALPVIP